MYFLNHGSERVQGRARNCWEKTRLTYSIRSKGLTLSLPRAINFKFHLQPHQKNHMTQYEELGFSLAYSDERWLHYQFLTTSLIDLSGKGWENLLFELGLKGLTLETSAIIIGARVGAGPPLLLYPRWLVVYVSRRSWCFTRGGSWPVERARDNDDSWLPPQSGQSHWRLCWWRWDF